MRVIIIHANPLQEVRVIKHPVHNVHLCACDAMITIKRNLVRLFSALIRTEIAHTPIERLPANRTARKQ